MALRNLSRTIVSRTGMRDFSKESNFVNVTVNDKNGIATLEMQRPPVNSLNFELLSQISAALTNIEKNKVRGLIITSKNDGVFSAGLDIMELYKPDVERLKLFWTSLQDTWIKLYGSPYPSVALINGHAPAGGCLLAMSCEYRVMFKNCSIGLNETQLGIVAPMWFINSMKNVIGHRQTEKALTVGKLFSTEEALSVGLIDEVIEGKEDGITKAEAFINTFARIPPIGRAITKKYVRGETIDGLISNKEKDLNELLSFATQPHVQDSLDVYIKNLKKKSSKA